MSFLRFLANYAEEAFAVGKALTSVLDGLAIDNKQASDINVAITKMENAHKSITEFLESNPKKPTTNIVKVSKKDLDEAVERYMFSKMDDGK